MGVLPNAKHELYAQELAQGRGQAEAYRLAGYTGGETNASRLASNDKVSARVAELQMAAAERVELTVGGVLMELWKIATADPGELVEFQIGCCRYCHGKRHRYQETPAERDRRTVQWERDRIAAAGTDREADFAEFNELGGLGFDARRPPAVDCPECFGRGEGETVFKDTRKISSSAKALYAGVKQTKEGLEVRMHDKLPALRLVGQHLGMFVDRKINTDVSLEDFLAQLDAAAPGEPGADEE